MMMCKFNKEPYWTYLNLTCSICLSSSQRLCMSHTTTAQAAKTFYDSSGSQSPLYLGHWFRSLTERRIPPNESPVWQLLLYFPVGLFHNRLGLTQFCCVCKIWYSIVPLQHTGVFCGAEINVHPNKVKWSWLSRNLCCMCLGADFVAIWLGDRIT